MATAQAATDVLSREDAGFLVSAHDEVVHLLLPAATAPELEPLSKAIAAKAETQLRAGAGSAVGVADVARSLREARYALQVCRLEGWTHAGFADLGTYRLLLSLAEPDALRAFADALLAPLDAYDRDQRASCS